YCSEDQYAVSSKKIRRIRACIHQRLRRTEANTPYPEDLHTPYLRYSMKKILEYINRGPYSKLPRYAVSNPLDTPIDRFTPMEECCNKSRVYTRYEDTKFTDADETKK
ncbi:hypothetical protein Tco_0946510, partial [Tanacetum coccineum]